MTSLSDITTNITSLTGIITDFHFLRPWWLLVLLPLAAFLVWFTRRRFERRRWQNIVDPSLMPYVLTGAGYRSRRRVTVLLALAGVLLITALAGPAWQRIPQPVFRNLDALVIALDLSRSMDVEDVKPSRLARVRFKINDILQQRKEGQTALLVYAAEPYVISPLTDDTNTIITQLPALTTELMPAQGSRADRALEKASELMRQAGAVSGQILLVTDGVNAARTAPVAKRLAAEGIRTSVLGVGTASGGPIPGEGGFIKQSDGSIVIAKLQTTELESIAAEGDGEYRPLSASDGDIDNLLKSMAQPPESSEDTGLRADVWREAGPWLLLPLLPLAALAFRRGVLVVWLLVLFMPVPPARAAENTFTTANLWSRPDQRASQLLTEGDAATAAETFTDPAWKAAAAYKAGRYEDSLAALEGLEDIDATYNRGNALAKLNRFDAAIAAYEDVLKRDPDHNDARYNLELLKKRQQQNPQDQQQNDQDQSDQEQQKQADQSKQEQENQPDQSGQQQENQSGQSGQNQSNQQQENQQDQSGQNQSDQQQENQQGQSGQNQPDQQQENQQTQSGQSQSGPQQENQTSPADQQQSNADAANAPTKEGTQPKSDAQASNHSDNEADEDGKDTRMSAAEASDEEQGADKPQDSAALTRQQPLDEDKQAEEQWLRKIPDDPGGLLRRKFYYQYQQTPNKEPEEESW